jgi:hypothetical protein
MAPLLVVCSAVTWANFMFCSAFRIPAPQRTPPFSLSERQFGIISRYRRRRDRIHLKHGVWFRSAKSVDDDDDEDDDEEDEDELTDPLSKGIDSVSWLPSVMKSDRMSEDLANERVTRAGSEILPLFPLGTIVYTPNSEHILNIFEPRYRKMYSDILMNGTKRFVVSMSHPTESGRFAATGVLFELKDLKEVSERTADQIKYICSHRVTGRVHIHRILNPSAWESRETYLRVEGTIVDDSGKAEKALKQQQEFEDDDEDEDDEESDEKKEKGKGATIIISNDVYGALQSELAKSSSVKAGSNPTEEKALRETFSNLVELQHVMEEDVRFTRASVGTLPVGPGPDDDGLWQTIRLWQSFADQRLMMRQNELQRDFQEKLQSYLKKERGLTADQLPRYAFLEGCRCIFVLNDIISINALTLVFGLSLVQRDWISRFVLRTAKRATRSPEAHGSRAEASST